MLKRQISKVAGIAVQAAEKAVCPAKDSIPELLQIAEDVYTTRLSYTGSWKVTILKGNVPLGSVSSREFPELVEKYKIFMQGIDTAFQECYDAYLNYSGVK